MRRCLLVEVSGLKFQGWLDSAPYNIGFPDQDLESLCKDFPDCDRWSIVEDLTMLRLTTHNFLACRPERDKDSQSVFSGEKWLSYFHTRHPSAGFSRWTEGKFTREGYESRRDDVVHRRENRLSPARAANAICTFFGQPTKREVAHTSLPTRPSKVRHGASYLAPGGVPWQRSQNLNQLGSGLNFLIRRSQLQILFLHERHELVEVL